jgi:hypothetical protein
MRTFLATADQSRAPDLRSLPRPARSDKFRDIHQRPARLLIHNSGAVETVQLTLGHSTPMIILNTYAHDVVVAGQRPVPR